MNSPHTLHCALASYAFAISWIACSTAHAANYYVDSVSGNDSSNGLNQAQAWKTIDKINALNLEPGDTVNLKAGSSFTVGDGQTVLLLMSNDSGSTSQPVIIRSYGSGVKPLLYQFYHYNRNSAALGFYGGVSNVIIDGLHLRGDTNSYHSISGRNGIDVFSTALYMNGAYNANVTIQNCEIQGGCRGLLLYNCMNFKVLNNYFHDINGANKNTRDWATLWPEQHPGPALNPATYPVGADDDSGAEVIDLNSYCDGIYIASNTVQNCSYTSHDYGTDGTFVEVYGTTTKNVEICYNTIVNVPGGTIEMGSWGGGTVENLDFHHNLISEGSVLYAIHMSGSYSLSDIYNLKFHNNTFVQRTISNDDLRPWAIFDVNGIVTDPNKVSVQNNIFYLKTGTKNLWQGSPASSVSSIYGNDDVFTHKYNIYYHAPGAGGRFSFATPPDATEKVGYNPYFTNVSSSNFTLTAASPAVDSGAILGYTRDLPGNVVYSASGPDLGAFESSHSGTPPPMLNIAASTAGAEQAGNLKARAYDADTNTRWCNDGTLSNAWIQFDLGATFSLNRVSLMLENNHIVAYPIKIQVGNGSSFTDVHTGTTSLVGWKTFQDFNFSAASGRYVRVLLTTANSQGYFWFSIWEAQCYGTTTASSSTLLVTSSTAGSEQAGNTKTMAYDGPLSTRWSSSGASLGTSWIQFDTGATSNINKVRLAFEDSHLRTYPFKIQVGNGTSFSDAFKGVSRLTGAKQSQDFLFPPISGRYVKVILLAPNSDGANILGAWEAKPYKTP